MFNKEYYNVCFSINGNEPIKITQIESGASFDIRLYAPDKKQSSNGLIFNNKYVVFNDSQGNYFKLYIDENEKE